jgi:hypothetical protein
MLVESGVEREAARAARYRITFACFCAKRPASLRRCDTHTRALSLDRDGGLMMTCVHATTVLPDDSIGLLLL